MPWVPSFFDITPELPSFLDFCIIYFLRFLRFSLSLIEKKYVFIPIFQFPIDCIDKLFVIIQYFEIGSKNQFSRNNKLDVFLRGVMLFRPTFKNYLMKLFSQLILGRHMRIFIRRHNHYYFILRNAYQKYLQQS